MNLYLHALGTILLTSTAFAQGGQESHGGIGFVCGKDSAPSEVLMLDLVEAEDGPMKLTFKKNFKSAEEALALSFERLSSNQVNKGIGKEMIERIKKGARFVNRDRSELTKIRSQLPLNTLDALPTIQLAGCEMRQIADYVTNGAMKVVKRYKDRFTPVHSAAFRLHEAIYKDVRQKFQMKSSLPVRRLVALLLSDQRDDQAISNHLEALMYGVGDPDVKHKKSYTEAEALEYVDYTLDSRTLYCSRMNGKDQLKFYSEKQIDGRQRIKVKLIDEPRSDYIFVDQEQLSVSVGETEEKGAFVEFYEEMDSDQYWIRFERYHFDELVEERRRTPPKISNAKSILINELYGTNDEEQLKCWLE